MPKKTLLVNSMTGFGTATGLAEGHRWSLEVRSVNGRGLDLRLRVPDSVEGLEKALRDRLSKALKRGSVSVGLRLNRDEGSAAIAVDPARIEAALDLVTAVETAAGHRGLGLAPMSAADILSLRGVMDGTREEATTAPLLAPLLASFDAAMVDFLAMRQSEGAAIDAVLRNQIDEVAVLVEKSVVAAGSRADRVRTALNTALAQIVEAHDKVDPGRVETELALLAVKADITEEIDRLRAHVNAAHDLLDQGGAVGRKLDFLMQEFNREANTLCSKAQSAELTRIGLDLKAVIDQMREQVQNVE